MASSPDPAIASARKMPRQEVKRSMPAPICGAMIGPRPVTSISVEKNRAAVAPSKRSRTMARAMTIPAAPPNPWMNRNPSSRYTVDTALQASEDRTKRPRPTNKGLRRPLRSLMGPMTSWPTAIPTKHPVTESWTEDALAWRSVLIRGSDGRYMSIQRGPKMDSPPMMSTRRHPRGTRVRSIRSSRAIREPRFARLVMRGDSSATGPWQVATHSPG